MYTSLKELQDIIVVELGPIVKAEAERISPFLKASAKLGSSGFRCETIPLNMVSYYKNAAFRALLSRFLEGVKVSVSSRAMHRSVKDDSIIVMFSWEDIESPLGCSEPGTVSS